MDVLARRQLWGVLERLKKGRVVVLTTHYMDEADFLGDRIAFMQNGKLQLVGSSLFLKNRFGIGYTLHLSLQQEEEQKAGDADAGEENAGGLEASALQGSQSVTELQNLLQRHVPTARLVTGGFATPNGDGQSSRQDVEFKLPLSSVAAFPDMFEALDTAASEMGVSGCV